MIKKILLFIFGFMILMIPNVNAEEYYTDYQLTEQKFISLNDIDTTGYVSYENYIMSFNPYLYKLYLYSDFNTFYSDSKNKIIFDTLYEQIAEYKNYEFEGLSPNYRISVAILSASSESFKLHSVILAIDLTYDNINTHFRYSNAYVLGQYYDVYENVSEYTGNGNFNREPQYPYFNTRIFSFSPFHDHYTNKTDSYKVYYPLFLFETNYPYTITNTLDTYSIYSENGNLKNTYSAGDERPVFFPDGFSTSSNYIEVFLDDYEYVILSLKDYSKTEEFETNLKVKGMIGITPVYEFGTIEKQTITDRCNISYIDYTNYRFFILENDLINNAVYYVKGCSTGAYFKFNSSLFDIHYVTAETVNDPVITVGGNSYNTIPFNKLSNSANNNESNNFVPGASEQFNPFESVVDYISSFWNSLTTFMGLVTKFFNTLPIEIRAISITCFTTACTLGLLKILKS